MAPERDLRARLGEETLLLDGGLGTLLIAKGLERGCAPERWNIEHPERVEEVHRAYVEAGSDIVATNTFGATPHKLAASGLGRESCSEINTAAISIAKRAAGGRALVAGDVGPSGLMLPPMGTATEEELRREFEVQVQALCSAGADLIMLETFFDLRECRAALVATRSLTGLPIFATMTFETKRRGTFTMVGDALVATLEQLAALGADAVGCNCSVTPDVMLPMIAEAKAAIGVPLIAQPNAGQARIVGDAQSYDLEPEVFVDDMMSIVGTGAKVVGGCCGTNPQIIAQLRRRIDSVQR